MGELTTVLDLVSRITVGTVAALFIWAAWRGEVTFGRELRSCQKQIDDNNARHLVELNQLRADFREFLAAEVARTRDWKELALEQRLVIEHSTQAAAELARKQHPA